MKKEEQAELPCIHTYRPSTAQHAKVTAWPLVLVFIYLVSFYKFIYLFIYFWLRWIFLAACGPSLVAASRLLVVVASLVAEHGL